MPFLAARCISSCSLYSKKGVWVEAVQQEEESETTREHLEDHYSLQADSNQWRERNFKKKLTKQNKNKATPTCSSKCERTSREKMFYTVLRPHTFTDTYSVIRIHQW